MAGVNDRRLADRLLRLSPRPADDADLLLCHTPAYVGLVNEAVAGGRLRLPTGDTPISVGSLDAARSMPLTISLRARATSAA